MSVEASPVIPVANAAVCLNCDAVTALGERCPACGSEYLMPLARWLGEVA